MRVPAAALELPDATVVSANAVRSVFCAGATPWKTCWNVGKPVVGSQPSTLEQRQRPRLNAAA